MLPGVVFASMALLVGSLPALAQPAPAAPRTPAPKPAPVPRTAQTAPRPAPPRGPGPHTLTDALAATYSYQPALLAERAKLRATDETVPQALAGWRPTVVLGGTAGYGDGVSRTYSSTLTSPVTGLRGAQLTSQTDRDFATAQATVTQNLYTSGKVQGNVNRTRNQVMAERATLIAQEQTSFLATVNAYVGVIQNRQLLELQRNNEQVLARQLQATNDRFRVGEITRTDVAQAEAALAGARAQRETAEANLATANATFRQIIGMPPPADMAEPQPLALPIKNEAEATAYARNNNPTVINALFNDAAAKDAVDIALAALGPQVGLQGQTLYQANPASRASEASGYVVTLQVQVPIYQGGAEYAAVRAARQTQQQTSRQIDDARRTAVQAAVQALATYTGARAAADSTRAQIRSNEVALEGVTREAIVGSRTTLDVLNAQQALLQSRTSLVQNLAQLVTASYQVAQAIGRLTARDLRLPVPLYDETAYYNAVKERWIGLGDYATDQPAR
jgi:outer membrane protein